MVFTARDSLKNPHVFQEESARATTGDVDERASRAPSSKGEKTRREKKNEREKKRVTRGVGGGKREGRTKEKRRRDKAKREGGGARERSIARLTGAQASYVLRLRYEIVGRLGRF